VTVALWLALVVLGAAAAAYASIVGASPAILAGGLTVAFVGLAGACAGAAAALGAPDDLTEPRRARGPTEPFALQPAPSRRTFGTLWFAALGALAGLGVIPLIALARKPGRDEPSGWRAGVRLVDETNRPLRLDLLDVGGIATVFPENGVGLPAAPAVLIRLPDRYVAYSKICTHAGCPAALYRHAAQELYCPCHQSRFDAANNARNLSGPAPRPLPQLALGSDARGFLIALRDFDAPVGPDDWDRVR
jgi:ubiquinol-cytochrome c reductase iron-sulfur subunit